MNGNIALSMEIGSAYALQVCLLQIPALVLYSALYGRFINPQDVIDHTFTLIFPQWDMITVILCVFLLSYMYTEGKSNYFKGSILILSYLVVIVGFWFSGFDAGRAEGVDITDTLALLGSPRFGALARNGLVIVD
jgi:Ca2+:H+ antiporter